MITPPTHIADVAELEEQFAQLQFESFTHEDALSLGMELAERAEQDQLPMVVAIYLGDQRIFYYACVGTTAENDVWVERKRRSVARFEEPTFLIGQRFAAAGKNFYEETGLGDDYVAHGGGFPVMVNGECVGAIVVSGIPHEEDHAFIVAALTAFREDVGE